MTTAQGYGIEATLTDTELRAHGTNKAAHFALVGKDGPAELVLPLAQIADVKHTPPAMKGLVNGHVVIRTTDGRKYEMHYRFKKQADFGAFADALVGTVIAAQSA